MKTCYHGYSINYKVVSWRNFPDHQICFTSYQISCQFKFWKCIKISHVKSQIVWYALLFSHHKRITAGKTKCTNWANRAGPILMSVKKKRTEFFGQTMENKMNSVFQLYTVSIRHSQMIFYLFYLFFLSIYLFCTHIRYELTWPWRRSTGSESLKSTAAG